jgi:hypothetical protein
MQLLNAQQAAQLAAQVETNNIQAVQLAASQIGTRHALLQANFYFKSVVIINVTSFVIMNVFCFFRKAGTKYLESKGGRIEHNKYMKAHFNAVDRRTFNRVATKHFNAAVNNPDGDDPLDVETLLKANNKVALNAFFDPVYALEGRSPSWRSPKAPKSSLWINIGSCVLRGCTTSEQTAVR